MSGTELFVEDSGLIWTLIFVVLTPFVTGAVLMIARAFELSRKKNISENIAGGIGVSGMAISWFLSLVAMIRYFTRYVTLGDHATVDTVVGQTAFLPMTDTAFNWGFMADPLSMIMLFVLTTIATLIHVYSTDYMRHDTAYTRFFGTMNFFTGSMIGFVIAGNLLTSFIFWELLGVSSYLLIGYYWPKKSAAAAGKKAFLYNKVGDVAFVFAIALTYARAKTLDYVTLKHMLNIGELEFADFALPAILLFGAAVGKSAQVPLLGWLPEAMEGPTPVSALLHSSTMVKAGLLLIARTFFTFYEVHDGHVLFDSVTAFIGNSEFFTPANIIAWTGTATALTGSLIALTATDIKKVLAFSTVSQLGYIAVAIGSGGLVAGFYHLIAHATFKSMLFLAAGAVIHSVHSQEMEDMGGLRTKMKFTYWSTLIGLLALSGIAPMSGFWSKDAVLLSIKESEALVGGMFLYWVAVGTAGITAFYSSKLLIKVFLKEPRYDKEHVHPHKASKTMRFVLGTLAGLVVLESLWWTIGTLSNSETILNFEHALAVMFNVHGGVFAFSDAVPSTLAVIFGGLLSFAIYYWEIPALAKLPATSVFQAMEKVVKNRFGLDLFIYWFARKPIMSIGNAFKAVDSQIIDEFIIDTVVTEGLALGLGTISRNVDEQGVDGFVQYLERLTKTVASKLKGLQSGQTSLYAKFMVLGLSVILSLFSLVTYDVISI